MSTIYLDVPLTLIRVYVAIALHFARHTAHAAADCRPLPQPLSSQRVSATGIAMAWPSPLSKRKWIPTQLCRSFSSKTLEVSNGSCCTGDGRYGGGGVLKENCR